LQKRILHISFVLISLVVINIIASRYYYRLDLTADKRYTLSEASKDLIDKIDQNMLIKVYLQGDFPLDFKRLQQATKQHIEELKIQNKNIHYRFINPVGKEKELQQKGLQPSRLTIEEEASVKELVLFPWAIISYNGKITNVPLLSNTQNTAEVQLQQSIENLEYNFSKAISHVTQKKRKSIAILRGNNELKTIYLYDFLKTLKEHYNLAEFTLKNTENFPKNTLEGLQKYDLTVIAKPTKAFSEKEKMLLDQYITTGGKTLWLLDYVTAEMDSLQQTGEGYFTARNLNLTDLLFSYGVRINANLVQDLYSSKITIATGNIGNKTQFKPFLWHYYPLVTPNTKHSITKNIATVNLKFPSSIDTLKNKIKKSILLQSSPLTKVSGLPSLVSLSSIATKVDPKKYKAKPQILGVLLEGKFTSAYQHRTKPFDVKFTVESTANKMIIIADGDVAANQILEGSPTRLDTDKWTGQHFGNKDFLLNAVDYLLDDSNLLAIRGKSLDIKFLNKEKTQLNHNFWQLINVILPLVLLSVFGLIYTYFRKKKYSS